MTTTTSTRLLLNSFFSSLCSDETDTDETEHQQSLSSVSMLLICNEVPY